MAISKLEVGVVPLGVGGDSLRSAAAKINGNFTDRTNAASRLVGPEDGKIPLAEDVFKLAFSKLAQNAQGVEFDCDTFQEGTTYTTQSGITKNSPSRAGVSYWTVKTIALENNINHFQIAHGLTTNVMQTRQKYGGAYSAWATILSTANTSKDSNGFLKGASPVVDMYDNKIDLNQDAEQQGGITFEKLGVGDYLIKGSLGFAQEGWHIETPKDTNGNVLVAVVETQLENNDLSIKAYDYMLNKKGRIVPDTETLLDIPEGRFISLRLHELPKEPPVMPTETQTEV